MSDSDLEFEESFHALVFPGSDYPAAYEIGAQIALQLEEFGTNVLVTRGSGALNVAYVVGRMADLLANGLRRGRVYRGRIVSVSATPQGRLLEIRLEKRG